MRTILNGKKYDTETAKEIGSDGEGYRNDFRFFQETLYRKKTGEFFLYGEGGAMSRYAKSSGDNSWGYGEKIIPLSEKDAKAWAEKALSVEDYEALFGEVAE